MLCVKRDGEEQRGKDEQAIGTKFSLDMLLALYLCNMNTSKMLYVKTLWQ